MPPSPRTSAQTFGFAFGALYILLGLSGFAVTGFDNFASDTNTRFAIFDINPLHNLVHLAIGVTLVAGATKMHRAGPVNGAVGAAYLAVAVVGLTGVLSFLSINAGLVPDFWLHLTSGIAALLFARTAFRRPSVTRDVSV